MKEMLKSKGIILYIVAFISLTYISAIGTSNMEESYKIDDSYIVLNTI